MKILTFCILLFAMSATEPTPFEKAKKFYEDGNFDKAQVIFKSLVDKNPKDLKSIEYLGDIESHHKNWDKALEYFKKLKDLKPSEADYHYKYGGALGMKAKDSNKFKALGMIDEIEGSFKKAIALDDKHIGSRWALIELYLQLPAIVGGSEKKAQKYANELIAIEPVDGYLSKGHIDEYFKRYGSAEKNYLKAHQVGKSKTTFTKLYDLYKNKMKKPEKAAELQKNFNK